MVPVPKYLGLVGMVDVKYITPLVIKIVIGITEEKEQILWEYDRETCSSLDFVEVL